MGILWPRVNTVLTYITVVNFASFWAFYRGSQTACTWVSDFSHATLIYNFHPCGSLLLAHSIARAEHGLFVCSSTDRHLDSVQVFAVVSSAAMNILSCVSVNLCVHSWGAYAGGWTCWATWYRGLRRRICIYIHNFEDVWYKLGFKAQLKKNRTSWKYKPGTLKMELDEFISLSLVRRQKLYQ